MKGGRIIQIYFFLFLNARAAVVNWVNTLGYQSRGRTIDSRFTGLSDEIKTWCCLCMTSSLVGSVIISQ